MLLHVITLKEKNAGPTATESDITHIIPSNDVETEHWRLTSFITKRGVISLRYFQFHNICVTQEHLEIIILKSHDLNLWT